MRTVAARHADAAPDRVHEQARELGLPAKLAYVVAPSQPLGWMLRVGRQRVEAGVLDAVGQVQWMKCPSARSPRGRTARG